MGWVGMMWGGCGGIGNIYDPLDKSLSVECIFITFIINEDLCL